MLTHRREQDIGHDGYLYNRPADTQTINVEITAYGERSYRYGSDERWNYSPDCEPESGT